ncbi:MAG: succinyl-CoA synthetase beta subunit/citryl-CoA synthetase large subunit [Chloroflexi bacterium]|jgi:succinyl-CoA synthetase beta subunit|nr:MAG: succinyl-CoA synthetase beta subunit/citryl-CoA synthetase large subunit [Chloroflexota bacterium]|tara:strand:- start:2951 stop:4159 length:1209 start_codon:yes stop_codon:yes gene_type:complete
MRFYEYESKQVLKKFNITIPSGGIATNPDDAMKIHKELNCEVVIKSQVLSGGRMKAGGVKFSANYETTKKYTEEILALTINNLKPVCVIVEPKSGISQEYYAAITWDGVEKKPVLIFSDMGGIDIEEVAEKYPSHVSRTHLSNLKPIYDYSAKIAVSNVGITGKDLNSLSRMLKGLIDIFNKYDLTLAEINPIAKLNDGSFIALDGHMDMEAEARNYHQDLLTELNINKEDTRQSRPPTQFEIDGAAVDAQDTRGVAGNVTEFSGNLGLIIGAGGGSLTLFDAVTNAGGKPANYCEIGGNPSVKKTAELTKLIVSKPGVEKIAVMMNVVSNTRVDIVARGVIKGVIEAGFKPKDKITIFRIPGSWEEEGFKILNKYEVEYVDRTVSMYEAANISVKKMQEEQ